MAVITRTYSSSDIATGRTIEAAHINTDVQALYDLQNAQLDTGNLKAAAGVKGSQCDLTDGTGGVYTKAGAVARQYENANVKYLEEKHDGTNAVITASSGKIKLVDSTGTFYFMGGKSAIVADGGNGYAELTLPVAVDTSKSAIAATVVADSSATTYFVTAATFPDTTHARVRVNGLNVGTVQFVIWAQTA